MIGVPLVEKLSRTSFDAKIKRGKRDPWETVSDDWNWNEMDGERIRAEHQGWKAGFGGLRAGAPDYQGMLALIVSGRPPMQWQRV